jgi:hypothetical protein
MIWRRIKRSKKWMDGMSDVVGSCRLHLNVPEQAETPRKESQHSAFCIAHSISNRLQDKGRYRVLDRNEDDRRTTYKMSRRCLTNRSPENSKRTKWRATWTTEFPVLLIVCGLFIEHIATYYENRRC